MARGPRTKKTAVLAPSQEFAQQFGSIHGYPIKRNDELTFTGLPWRQLTIQVIPSRTPGCEHPCSRLHER